MARLGDIATYINGYAFKPSDWSDSGVPIIRIQDLTGNSYQANRYRGKYAKKYEVLPGDVLISWSASLGIYVWEGERAVLNQHIFKVVFDKCEVDKSFFVHQVQNILEKAASSAHGATMKHLTKPIFDALPFYLPPLEEQRRIAALLDKVSDLIAKRRAQLNKLDLLVKARFVEMFGDPNLTSSIWDMSTLGQEFFITSGGTPSTVEPTYWEGGTISWIGSNMCQDTILYGNDGKFITPRGLERSSAKVFPSGTVLVALVGATIGKTALLRFNTATNQNIAAIDVLGNKRFCPEFIFYELQMLYEKFQELGSEKFKMANQGFVRGLPTICPPLELQKEFEVFVKVIQKSKLTIQQSLDKLEMLEKALIQQYFGALQ